MYVYPDDPGLKYMGRIDFDDPKAPILIYPSTTISMAFTGRGVSMILKNHHSCWSNRLGYVLDGVHHSVLLDETSEEREYVLASDLDDGLHHLLVYKRQDSAHFVTFLGFKIAGELGKQKPLPIRKIEVYGDSVSCGEVSEAVSYVGRPDPVHNGQYSNSWHSYCWILARDLGAQIHNISQGGIALLDGTGYFGAPGYIGMESSYDKLEYLPDLMPVKQWDFKKYTPHVVIIAIGQNDAHPENYMAEDYNSEKSQNWRNHYKEFVKKIRGHYPRATIILATTILMHDKAWDDSIDEVCRELGDDKIHHFMYKRNGSGTPGHIRIPEAREMADELVEFINELGSEIWM